MSFADVVNSVMQTQSGGTVFTDQLVNFLKNREDTYAQDTYFHVSHLYYMCPRQEVLKRIIPAALLKEDLDVKMKAKFDIGHALHAWYQNEYMGPMGTLYGSWACIRCGDVQEGFMPKGVCDACGAGKKGRKNYKLSPRWEYVETPVLSVEWNIKGKSDGIVIVNGNRHVVDLKTCDPELFKKMTKPWYAALYQVQIYMWLLDIKKGVVVYIDKSSNTDTPVKEFPVEYSIQTINDAQSKITDFRLAQETRILPACRCGKSKFSAPCGEVECLEVTQKALAEWESAKEGVV